MKQVLLLVCRGVEMFELAAFYDVLGWANEYGDSPIQVVTAGLEKEVSCAFGLAVRVDRLLDEVGDCRGYDGMAIPGGFEAYGYYSHAYAAAVTGLIRRFAGLGRPIASICVGALPLGNSGVLQNRRGTTYPFGEKNRRKQLAEFGVAVEDGPIVWDGNTGTSTSPATAVEMAFQFLSRLTGEQNAAKIRSLMGFPPDPGKEKRG